MIPHDDAPEIEGPDVDSLLLIVVGSHLRAEVGDRPLAYAMRKRITSWLNEHENGLNFPLTPVVCSDIWYVNQSAPPGKPSIHSRPTISIGGPGVNALSAFYANRLNTSLVRDEQLMIQLDPELIDLRASIWGRDHEQTAMGVELFSHKYLADYLRAAVTQVEPQED